MPCRSGKSYLRWLWQMYCLSKVASDDDTEEVFIPTFLSISWMRKLQCKCIWTRRNGSPELYYLTTGSNWMRLKVYTILHCTRRVLDNWTKDNRVCWGRHKRNNGGWLTLNTLFAGKFNESEDTNGGSSARRKEWTLDTMTWTSKKQSWNRRRDEPINLSMGTWYSRTDMYINLSCGWMVC